MLKDIQTIEQTTTFKGWYEGKELMFSFYKDIYDWQGTYKILEYDGRTDIPNELEKKLLDLCEEIDFGEVDLL